MLTKIKKQNYDFKLTKVQNAYLNSKTNYTHNVSSFKNSQNLFLIKDKVKTPNPTILFIDNLKVNDFDNVLNVIENGNKINYQLIGQLLSIGHFKANIESVVVKQSVNINPAYKCDFLIELLPKIKTDNTFQNISCLKDFELSGNFILDSNYQNNMSIKIICGLLDSTLHI